ncbi:hypothetical protein FACS1894122_15810 [Alphaproteobacteria bacterium]|nr:hypothetical protein FACS1894122_15810 [Alphaproteobacteria bacterium]
MFGVIIYKCFDRVFANNLRRIVCRAIGCAIIACSISGGFCCDSTYYLINLHTAHGAGVYLIENIQSNEDARRNTPAKTHDIWVVNNDCKLSKDPCYNLLDGYRKENGSLSIEINPVHEQPKKS